MESCCAFIDQDYFSREHMEENQTDSERSPGPQGKSSVMCVSHNIQALRE